MTAQHSTAQYNTAQHIPNAYSFGVSVCSAIPVSASSILLYRETNVFNIEPIPSSSSSSSSSSWLDVNVNITHTYIYTIGQYYCY
jgi:hypothetical protein